jgi:hypothetical protein
MAGRQSRRAVVRRKRHHKATSVEVRQTIRRTAALPWPQLSDVYVMYHDGSMHRTPLGARPVF